MSITIQMEKVMQLAPVTIETPYYYKQYIDSGDGFIATTSFGKITEDHVTSVQKNVREQGTEVSYEVAKDTRPDFNHYKAYLMDSKYASNKQEFDEALLDMKQFLEREAA